MDDEKEELFHSCLSQQQQQPVYIPNNQVVVQQQMNTYVNVSSSVEPRKQYLSKSPSGHNFYSFSSPNEDQKKVLPFTTVNGTGGSGKTTFLQNGKHKQTQVVVVNQNNPTSSQTVVITQQNTMDITPPVEQKRKLVPMIPTARQYNSIYGSK